jgi:hypothetical protein
LQLQAANVNFNFNQKPGGTPALSSELAAHEAGAILARFFDRAGVRCGERVCVLKK